MGDVAAMTWPLSVPGGALLQPHRARRCLFGPPDAEKTKLDLKALMDDVDQQNKLRWNFDFQKGVPIAGRYKWEPVKDPDDADSNGGSEMQQETTVEQDSTKKEVQTHITDFMRKRKSSNQKETVTLRSKTRRRSST